MSNGIGGTFWVPVTLPSPPHFLQEGEQGSQDHLARGYLQICCANNHPHNISQFIVPHQGSSAQNPGEVPCENPAPRCLPNTLVPGSARPSRRKTRCFPRELRERVSDVSHLPFRSPLREPTRVSRARGQKAGRSPPESALTRSPAPFSLPLPPSLLPSSSSPRASCASSAQRLSRLRGGNFFRG